MALEGDRFIFDGIPSDYYNLMLYTFDGSGKEESDLGTNVKIIEDRISRRCDGLHYGTTKNDQLTFPITFGSLDYLDQYDVDVIAGWLTGHNTYKILEIPQPDMEYVRYKCFLNNMKKVTIAGVPIAFTCDVVCDSPFAYSYPMDYVYIVNGETSVSLFNKTSFNGNLYPKMTITPSNLTSEISIQNLSDNNRIFKFTDIPYSSGMIINIDNKNQLITTNITDLNLYPKFNNKFFRLIKGQNNLLIKGNGIITITCEYPMKVGG